MKDAMWTPRKTLHDTHARSCILEHHAEVLSCVTPAKHRAGGTCMRPLSQHSAFPWLVSNGASCERLRHCRESMESADRATGAEVGAATHLCLLLLTSARPRLLPLIARYVPRPRSTAARNPPTPANACHRWQPPGAPNQKQGCCAWTQCIRGIRSCRPASSAGLRRKAEMRDAGRRCRMHGGLRRGHVRLCGADPQLTWRPLEYCCSVK